MGSEILSTVVWYQLWSNFYNRDEANGVQSFVCNCSILQLRHWLDEYKNCVFLWSHWSTNLCQTTKRYRD